MVYDTYRRLDKKYQVLLMQTRIFYDYVRTRISEPKSAYFKIDKFSLVFYFINTLVHELNSFESLVILAVTNNRRYFISVDSNHFGLNTYPDFVI